MTESKKVLVIDDDSDFADYVRTILGGEGYDVLIAADGVAGMETARQERPSVILVDLLMAPEDGFTVCERLRACPETRGAAVGIVSAIQQKLHKTYASPDVGARLDVDAFLDKPFDPGTLVRTVDKLQQLAERRARDASEDP